MACWHTTRFVFSKKIHEIILRSALRRRRAFYYLMHPGDLLDRSDLDGGREIRMERLGPSLSFKQDAMEHCIRMILESGREAATMEEIARSIDPPVIKC